VIEAGCDVALHCSGDMAEMEAVASAIPAMTPASVGRLERAMATIATQVPRASYADLAAKRDSLLSYA
jgi:beta-N-acetylhexosaminidase